MDMKFMELIQAAIEKLVKHVDNLYESSKQIVLEIQALRLQNATQRIINQYLLEMSVHMQHDDRKQAQAAIDRIRELNKE